MQSNLVPTSDLPTEHLGAELVPEHDLPTDYESTGQQFKTAAEGAAQGIAGPLATLAETKLLGVNPEDIRGRAEANPGIHAISEGAGLVGGALIPGVGEYSLGAKISQAGGAAAKLASHAIAQSATRAASEMALIAAADETSKWLQNDPNQSIQSAISNIGLSAALGGAGGAVFTKAGSIIKGLGNKAESLPAELKVGFDPFTKEEIQYTAKPRISNFDPFTKQVTEAPIRPPVESDGIGSKMVEAIKKYASEASLEAAGAGTGAAIGHMTGIPGAGWVGAYLGKTKISPILKSIIPAIGKSVMEGEVNPLGFMSAVNSAELAIKGRLGVIKAAQSVFDKSTAPEPVDQKERDILDAKVRALQNDPVLASKAVDNRLSHYMPDHAMSLGSTIGQAVQYLNSIRPDVEKKSPLDSKQEPNPIAQSVYNRALDLAQAPLNIMNNIQHGTLTSKDIAHLHNMYPALYDQMKSELMHSMVEHLSKDNSVPYKTRLSLSLFLGQPLDSSMKSASIIASQPQPQQQQNKPVPATRANKMGQIASMDATPLQAQGLKEAKRNRA